MNKSKAARCKYNTNRHAADLVHPYCTWKTAHEIVMPPNVYWAKSGQTTEETCKKCKCFEEAQ